jgi:hypothetical protein
MKRKIIFIIGCILLSHFAFSQKGKSKISSKTVKEANHFFETGDYNHARKLFTEIYKEDSTDATIAYKLGVSIYNLKVDRMETIPLFELAARDKNNEAHFYLGNLYHLKFHFEDALTEFNTYLDFKGQRDHDDDEVNRLKNSVLYASEMMRTPQEDVKIENMGPTINSSYSDYSPLLSSDETVIYFTSRRDGSTGNLLDPNGEYFEDIYVSYKKDGRWTPPESVSDYINTFTHDATVALSPGGNELYIYRTNEDLVSGNIYISKLDGRDWSQPVKITSEVNSEGGWESSASITADGEVIYFSSNREGGFGGKDIYRIQKLPNGNWSKAFNMGPTINTSFDEDFPFIHPDGHTLSFSSKGHKTMGGFDIFTSQVSTWGAATEPENLGYPINTVEDDVCFVLSTDGKHGYYSSIRPDTYGSTDIYKIKMPERNAPIPVIRARVLAADKFKPIQAHITLIDEETKDVVGDYTSNFHNGSFIMVFTLEKYYKLLVEAPGYHPYSDDFWISEIPGDGYQKEIKLVKEDEVKK